LAKQKLLNLDIPLEISSGRKSKGKRGVMLI
jgi:hypothetical protein